MYTSLWGSQWGFSSTKNIFFWNYFWTVKPHISAKSKFHRIGDFERMCWKVLYLPWGAIHVQGWHLSDEVNVHFVSFKIRIMILICYKVSPESQTQPNIDHFTMSHKERNLWIGFLELGGGSLGIVYTTEKFLNFNQDTATDHLIGPDPKGVTFRRSFSFFKSGELHLYWVLWSQNPKIYFFI